MFLIPDWLVYASMFYLSFMGIWCSRKNILIDPVHFLIFIPQGLMYVVFDIIQIPIVDRAAYVRFSLFLIPFVLSCVLTVEYWKRT